MRLLPFLFCISFATALSPIELLENEMIADFNDQVENISLSYSDRLCLKFHSNHINEQEREILNYLRSHTPFGGVKVLDIRELTPSGVRNVIGFSNIEHLIVNKIIHTSLLQGFPKIESFSVEKCQMSADELQRFFKSVSTNKMRFFEAGCSFGDKELTVSAPYFRYLEKLHLIAASITDDGLAALAPYVTKLSELNICSCQNVTELGLWILGDYLQNITSLNLNTPALSDFALEALTQNANHFESLTLGTFGEITNDGLKFLFSNLSVIRKLELNGAVADQLLVDLAPNASHLEHLKLEFIKTSWSFSPDAGLQELASNLTNIKYFELKGPASDRVLKALCQNVENLEVLKLVECASLTGEGLVYLSSYLLNLHTLELSEIYKINKGLKALNLENVHTLSLSKTDFSDKAFIEIAPSLKNLRYLSLIDCKKITDAGIKAVRPYLKNLVDLKVN